MVTNYNKICTLIYKRKNGKRKIFIVFIVMNCLFDLSEGVVIHTRPGDFNSVGG